ncbi:MAG TPA: tetratricopeptide repeat protein [Candidatus Dormibacteraeota bacterium]
MAMTPAREGLLAVARSEGDVAEGALWIAAEDCPGVQPGPWLERIDELAGELSTRCGIHGCSASDAPLVAGLLRDRLRLRGAGGGDPRAHYLHSVLDSGAGIPIACAAIWIAVGRRAAIPIEGVNMPGHFLVRVQSLLFDTTDDGQPLDDESARELVSAATGEHLAELEPRWLATATTCDMLVRMSRNLRGCHTLREDWPLAMRAADRCVDLLPEDPIERRDRGLLLWRLGRSTEALGDIRFYLDTVPDDVSDRSTLEEIAGRLRAFMN